MISYGSVGSGIEAARGVRLFAVIAVLILSTAARAEGSDAPACRIASETEVTCSIARLDEIRDSWVDRSVKLVRCEAARDRLYASSADRLRVDRLRCDAEIRQRDLTITALSLGLTRPEDPPERWRWALGAGGTGLASVGVGCAIHDGCPSVAGWASVAAGVALAAVGLLL